MSDPFSSEPTTNANENISGVVCPSPDTVTDTRIDAIVRRFSWFANPDHQWSSSSEDIRYPSQNCPSIHTPTMYHLRRRPNIHCPACLRGELGQLGHMEGPYGCLYTEQVVENE
jgi:hypothetical protein